MTLPARRFPTSPQKRLRRHNEAPAPTTLPASGQTYPAFSSGLSQILLPGGNPILLKDIRLQYEPNGFKRISIEFDGYFKPLFASIMEGNEPEVRVTINNAKVNPKIPKITEVSGKYLRRIRTVKNGTNGEVNIILDMQPHSDCRISYVHYLGMNLFCIDITDQNHPKS
jgi:hypothetical protein